MSPANRTQIEIEMRRRLLEAQRAYQSAVAKTKALMDKYRKLPDDQASHFDLRQAMAAEEEALEDYRDTLKEFTDLILRGKRFERDVGHAHERRRAGEPCAGSNSPCH
jgi:uncharacterized membrane protein YccC